MRPRSELFLLVIFLAACGGRRAEQHVIAIKGMTFEPATLTIAAGDKVVWKNEDLVAHTATAAGRFDSGSLAAGATFEVTLTKPGNVAYGCSLHPTMKATIVVK